MAYQKIIIGLLVAVAVLLPVGIETTLILPSIQSGGPKPTVDIILYAKEIAGAEFGFGLSPVNITSPGPTLRFKVGDVVNLTLVNIGNIPHSFAIVSALSENAPVVFDSTIGTGSQPLLPGSRMSKVFKVNQLGKYYYMCTVPGHEELGMYGNVEVVGS